MFLEADPRRSEGGGAVFFGVCPLLLSSFLSCVAGFSCPALSFSWSGLFS